QREKRRPQPQQRRRHHHEEQVLHHVDLQQQRRKRLDRRRQRQEKYSQAAQEGGQPAARPALRVAAAQYTPAAQVNYGRQQEGHENPRVERPGAQHGVERRVHGRRWSDEWAAGAWEGSGASAGERAGSWPRGRRLTRKATRALTSAGLSCLPYAGMSPPP